MPNIEIYTKDYCPYCTKVKEFLKRKGYGGNITEIDITNDTDLAIKMVEKAGGQRTVPQVFINGKHIGGCDATIALDSEGKLDALLKRN